mmetsp:Transcript_55875/g.120863  ORF Transcript_55875/g.120863 Transcript_55875/m.120863 type:complete len:220 (+) Transcript_55875:198-857(+)
MSSWATAKRPAPAAQWRGVSPASLMQLGSTLVDRRSFMMSALPKEAAKCIAEGATRVSSSSHSQLLINFIISASAVSSSSEDSLICSSQAVTSSTDPRLTVSRRDTDASLLPESPLKHATVETSATEKLGPFFGKGTVGSLGTLSSLGTSLLLTIGGSFGRALSGRASPCNSRRTSCLPAATGSGSHLLEAARSAGDLPNPFLQSGMALLLRSNATARA